MIIPALATARLRLEPLSLAHSAGMFALFREPEVCRYAGPAQDAAGPIPLPAETPADTDRIIALFMEGAASGGWFRWAILARDGEFLGAVGFNRLGHIAEFAYHLHPSAWGNGYMREAAEAALAWRRSQPEAEEVEAFIHPENAASIGLATRLGFRRAGGTRERRRYVLSLAPTCQPPPARPASGEPKEEPTMITARPEDVGLSSARLARVDGWMDKWVASGRLPGLSITINRRGKTVYHRTTGKRSVETGAPMTSDTIVRIYSMTKPLTSVALMMLYEEGHFLLDDPITRVLPAWRNQRVLTGGNAQKYDTVPAERDITYRDLLTHTSGLAFGFVVTHPVDQLYVNKGIDFIWVNGRPKEPVTLAEMTDRAGALPLMAQPGKAWNYSIATDIIGRLVEIHGGMPFAQFMAERVTGPLGMVDTGFHVPEASQSRFAANYIPDGKGGMKLFDDPTTSQYLTAPPVPSGAGGLVSTAGDYMRFCQMMLNGGTLDGVRLLGRKTVELMTANHLGGDMASMGKPRFSEANYEGIGFGLGFSVMLDPARAQIMGTPGEYAWGGAASTAFWCDPKEEMAVVMLTQLLPSSTYPIRSELKVLTYQAVVD